jgi:oxazoline/thiazoline dehydrogenase
MFTLSILRHLEMSERPGGEEIVIQSGARRLALRAGSPLLRAALARLADGGATESQLAAPAREAGRGHELPELYFLLAKLGEAGFLAHTVLHHGQPLATAVPISSEFRMGAVEALPGRAFVLYRFAVLRACGGDRQLSALGSQLSARQRRDPSPPRAESREPRARAERAWTLESPLSHARVLLPGSEGAALVAALAAPADCRALAAACPSIPESVAARFLSLLAGAGMVVPVDESGGDPEEEGTLAQWEFHDLFFHARSRRGRSDAPFGGTFRFEGRIPPLPAVKPAMSAPALPLYRPEIVRLMEADVPFTRVLEERQSIRKQGAVPITDRQLGEFLYRCARIRCLMPGRYEACSRPYPAGGALHELELYVVVRACENLAPGLYHYDALEHRLEPISGTTPQTEALLNDARRASGGCLPQLLFVITARFQRVSWKYQSMAYALILKHVGVLYQTMYLVATAMGLAPCALGCGDADLFAEAAGLDYTVESSVGEFMLGSV